MDEKDIRLRSLYLFLVVAEAVDHYKERLLSEVAELKAAGQGGSFNASLRQEVALLFRHWAARSLWKRLEARADEATRINQRLLRLFTEGFKLPRDGSGVHYAALLTLEEEGVVFSERLFNTLALARKPSAGMCLPLIDQGRETVLEHCVAALTWPLERLTKAIEAMSEKGVGESSMDKLGS